MKLETYLNAMITAILVADKELHLEKYRHRRHRQYRAFRSRILRMDEERDRLIRTAAELEYHNQVVATGMEKDMIGGDNYEYADKEDWIDSWMYGLKIWMEEKDGR